MKQYVLSGDIYVDPDRHQPFNYSDGEDAENYILTLIEGATDLSTGSEELVLGIKDWPSLYHLNPKRADLLRPLADRLKERSVLEIGSGCGAITRYLGELGCSVTALEGSQRRARITRQRCRGMNNVKVICDNFQDLSGPEKFDVITLIGVLEYSNLFIQADHPAEVMLQKVRTFLNPGGYVLIAIENKLGLKYLAGAPEDHLDKPYFGIENKYTHSTVTTFGKAELKNLLEDAGFADSSFLYPFPDYKLPKVILTEKGMKNESLLVGELLIEKLEYFQNNAYINNFSTTLAAEVFAQNRVLSDFSNSFLVVACPHQEEGPSESNILAYTYSTIRKKPFCKENIFQLEAPDQIRVIRRNLYDRTPDPQAAVQQKVENELYHPGILLSRLLVNLVSRNGWSLEELRPWARTYYTILSKHALIRNNQPVLEGKYLDLTPFNILLTNGSEIHIFDQEWVASEELPIHYIFFRGIRYSLGDISFFNPPAEDTPQNLLELSVAIANTAFGFTPAMLQECMEREKKYFTPINFGEFHSFETGDIRIRGTYQREQQFRRQEAELNRLSERSRELDLSQHYTRQLSTELEILKNEAEDLRKEANHLRSQATVLRSQLDETRHIAEDAKERSRLLENEKTWYIRTYEERSLMGLLKDRIRIFR